MGDPLLLPPDAELVDRLRAGDEGAFRAVLDAWAPSMLRLARSFVSTGDSAEEVVQEAWLGVIQGIERFEGRSALKTWVFRILVNIAKGRGAKESRTLPFSSLLPEDEATLGGSITLPAQRRRVSGALDTGAEAARVGGAAGERGAARGGAGRSSPRRWPRCRTATAQW